MKRRREVPAAEAHRAFTIKYVNGGNGIVIFTGRYRRIREAGIRGLGDLVIQRLSRVYADAEEGKPLALINSSDWLEVAVNRGRASDYVSVDSGEMIGAEVKVSKFK